MQALIVCFNAHWLFNSMQCPKNCGATRQKPLFLRTSFSRKKPKDLNKSMTYWVQSETVAIKFVGFQFRPQYRFIFSRSFYAFFFSTILVLRRMFDSQAKMWKIVHLICRCARQWEAKQSNYYYRLSRACVFDIFWNLSQNSMQTWNSL